MISPGPKEIFHFLFERQAEMIDFLERLVLIESPSSIPDSQAYILSLLLETFQGLEFDVRLIPGHETGGHLLARRNDDENIQNSQLLLGHCDTVWPIGTLKEMPLSIEENRIKGPGVYDMKGGLTQLVFALKTITELRLHMQLSPVVFINSDEEIGSIESGVVIESLAQKVERVFVLEPSLGPEGKLKTARKGVGRFDIVVNGRAAHAGLDPEKGISAVLELSHLIQKLFAMNDLEKGISVNVGTVEGGIRPNVIAPRSSAVVDVRVPSMDEAERIENEILNLQPVTEGITLQISGKIKRPPLERTPANRQLWNLAKDLGEQSGLSFGEGRAGGGSDGNITSQYTATLDGLGAVGDGAHARHEFVLIDKMIERTALLVQLLISKSFS